MPDQTKPKKKKSNKRVTPRAATFARLAKTLRVRAMNYRAAAKIARKDFHVDAAVRADKLDERAAIFKDLAADFDNEAATLRAMR